MSDIIMRYTGASEDRGKLLGLIAVAKNAYPDHPIIAGWVYSMGEGEDPDPKIMADDLLDMHEEAVKRRRGTGSAGKAEHEADGDKEAVIFKIDGVKFVAAVSANGFSAVIKGEEAMVRKLIGDASGWEEVKKAA